MLFKSIGSRVSFVAVSILVSSLAVLIFICSSMTNDAVLGAQQQSMKQLGEQISFKIDDYVDGIHSSLEAFSFDKTIVNGFSKYSSKNEADKRIAGILKSFPHMNNLFCFDTAGKIISGLDRNGKSIAGIDLRSRQYVNDILSGRDLAISTVIKAKDGSGLTLVFAVPVVDANGKLIGGLATAVDWKAFSSKFIDNITIGHEGYAYIIDRKGIMMAHKTNKSLILTDVSKYDFVKRSLAGSRGFINYDWEGKSKILSFQRVPKTGWVVCMTVYKSDLIKAATRQRNVLLVSGGILSLLLAFLIITSIRRMVLNPILRIRDYTSEIAQGNYRAVLENIFKFELKDLASDITDTVDELKNKLGFSDGVLRGITIPFIVTDSEEKILFCNKPLLEYAGREGQPEEYYGRTLGNVFYNESNRKTLTSKAIDENKAIMNVSASMTNLAGVTKHGVFNASPLYDLDGNLIGAFSMVNDITEEKNQQEQIQEQAERITQVAAKAIDIAEQVSSAAGELSSQIDESSSGAHTQRELTAEAATAMEQMNVSVLEVANNAENAAALALDSREKAIEGEGVVSQVVEEMRELRNIAEVLQNDMTHLGVQAEGIGQIVTVINDIADQTNLLALNAAIEAARAGEAGRGFAVVADEVRKLAEKTVHATSEVSEYISAIQLSAQNNISNMEQATVSVDRATDLAGNSGKALAEIVTLVGNSTDQVRSIATASEEQSAASEQIARSASQVNTIAEETASAMEQSAVAVSQQAKLSEELRKVISSMQEAH